jgi:stress response protein YsnF
MEKVVPIYAEEVIISKRLVKIADITIRKRKVTRVNKVDIGTATEELTIRNPTGISPAFGVDE